MTQCTDNEDKHFEIYFSLEEAVALIPFVKESVEKAHQELQDIKDEIVLYKRLLASQEEEGLTANDPPLKSTQEVLQQKWMAFEACFNGWVELLTLRGIQVRNIETGLVDFPYMTATGEEFLLCWHLGEDGLFYFHDIHEGFMGRRPISLLPE